MPNTNIQSQYSTHPTHRDVTSTARLFNFNRPVFISNNVWHDCVEINFQGKNTDELAVLQRLRHLLFMAASTLHGRTEDMQIDFRIYRIPNVNTKGLRQAEEVTLHLDAHRDENDRPVITIRIPGE